MKLEQFLSMARSQLLIRASLKPPFGATSGKCWDTTVVLYHWDGHTFCAMTYLDRNEPETGVDHTFLTSNQSNSSELAKSVLAGWRRNGEELWLHGIQFVGYMQNMAGCKEIINCHYLLIPHYARLEVLLQKRSGYPRIIHRRFFAFYEQQLESWNRIAAHFEQF